MGGEKIAPHQCYSLATNRLARTLFMGNKSSTMMQLSTLCMLQV